MKNLQKRIFLIALMGILLSLGTQAQSTKEFDLGIKAHPLLGFLRSSTNGVVNRGTVAGFAYGLMLDYNFQPNYSFNSEFSITATGGKTRTTDGNTVTDTRYRLQFIEIPVSLKLRTNKVEAGQFYGQFGLVPGINIKSTIEGTTTTSGVSNDFDKTNNSDQTNFFRVGLLIGAGLQYDLGNNANANFGVSLNNGFTDFAKGPTKLNNSYLAFNFGIFF